MSFETFLKLIQEQDPVRAGTINLPLRQVDQNTRYLWDLLQAAAIGSTVYAHSQSVEAAAKNGMPVWFNPITAQFERGLAIASVDVASGAVVTAPSAQIWGIVANKLDTTLADILLFGLDNIDISQAVSGPVMPGVYYLSGSSPGMLIAQKPPVSVAVLRVMGDGRIFVMPQFIDMLDRHTHYKFALVCSPAGNTTPPASGHKHVISSPSTLLQGWLPASDSSFDNLAPPGAVFGYNLAAHPQLKGAWPPMPSNVAYVEWDKGIDSAIGFTGVPMTGSDPLCIVDGNGIWWMSDCYSEAPWPVDLDTTNPTSASSSITDQCPRVLHMAMNVWFTKINFLTDQTAVLSLRSNDERLKIYCTGTETPASTGNLTITLDLNLVVETGELGYSVLKTFDSDQSQFLSGHVIEGLYAVSDNVSLTGDVVSTRTVGDTDRQIYQGLVGVSVQPQNAFELDVQLVRLDGAEEQFYQDFMYLSFPAGVQTDYRAKILVPANSGLVSPQLKLRFQILGRAAGTLPALSFSGRRLPRPNGTTPQALPTLSSEFVINCTTTAVLTSTDQYVEVESDPFTVADGDSVFFTVQRSATDGYPVEVGILRQVGVVSGE